MALYCFANNQITTALKLLYRARYLALIVCGENHPEVALLDSNIGLILHAVGEYDLSLRFLEKALNLNKKYYGARSLKGKKSINLQLFLTFVYMLNPECISLVAVSYHLVARTQSCMGDFRSALQNEKETYTIYKLQVDMRIASFLRSKNVYACVFISWVKSTKKRRSRRNVCDT